VANNYLEKSELWDPSDGEKIRGNLLKNYGGGSEISIIVTDPELNVPSPLRYLK
jgi:hypothetical protein